ncbi:hypothetical protein BH10PAT3_BH10PAT3_1370 [soil metagenome]
MEKAGGEQGRIRLSEADLAERVLNQYLGLQKLVEKQSVEQEIETTVVTAWEYLVPLDSEFEDGKYEHYWYVFLRIGQKAVAKYDGQPESIKLLNDTMYDFVGVVMSKVNYGGQTPSPANHAST